MINQEVGDKNKRSKVIIKEEYGEYDDKNDK